MMKCRLELRSTRKSILPPLMSATAFATSMVTVPVLGVRHQVTGTQDLTQATDLTHHVGGCNRCVEVGPAAGDLCDQVVGTNEVSASCLSLSDLGASLR